MRVYKYMRYTYIYIYIYICIYMFVFICMCLFRPPGASGAEAATLQAGKAVLYMPPEDTLGLRVLGFRVLGYRVQGFGFWRTPKGKNRGHLRRMPPKDTSFTILIHHIIKIIVLHYHDNIIIIPYHP